MAAHSPVGHGWGVTRCRLIVNGNASPITVAGAVVADWRDGAVRLLLVRSSDGNNWLFPKGHIEDGESAEEAALRETREEAGVDGVVIAPLGAASYVRARGSGAKPVNVEFFLVEYRGPAQSDEAREQRWCTRDEALALMSFGNLKPMAELAFRAAQAHFTDQQSNR